MATMLLPVLLALCPLAREAREAAPLHAPLVPPFQQLETSAASRDRARDAWGPVLAAEPDALPAGELDAWLGSPFALEPAAPAWERGIEVPFAVAAPGAPSTAGPSLGEVLRLARSPLLEAEPYGTDGARGRLAWGPRVVVWSTSGPCR